MRQQRVMIAVMAVLATLTAAVAGSTPTARLVREWRFDRDGDLQGWSPNGEVRDVKATKDGLHFQSVGSDPILVAPLFDPIVATDRQYVEIEIASDHDGNTELYFTNTTQDPYSGFRPEWMVPMRVPVSGAAGRVDRVYAYPFWGSLGKIIRIRFDPPGNARCRLVAIRVLEDTSPLADEPRWNPDSQRQWWPVFGINTRPAAGGVELIGEPGEGLLMTPVKPFAAESRALLKVEVENAASVWFGWATRECPGLRSIGVPVVAERPGSSRGVARLDLRGHPLWNGTVTAVAIGTTEGPTILRSLELSEPAWPRPLVPRFLGMVHAINRPNREALVRWVVENATDRPQEGGAAELRIMRDALAPGGVPSTVDDAAWLPAVRTKLGTLEPKARGEFRWPSKLGAAGRYGVAARFIGADGKPACDWEYAVVRVDPAVEAPKAEYVPAPRPVATDYDIGVYYFPGWAPGPKDRWLSQVNYPERDPVLGYYREGEPSVADWHIKWAVENGIRFFIYDWYWRNGKIELQEGLHDGLLKAKYRDRLKFCLMWANHPPFSSHTKEQLVQVTEYCIEHYFRQPNYYCVDGKPYFSFFSVEELPKGLGSEQKVREAFDAMRERVRAAGFKDLCIVACGSWGEPSQQRYKAMGFDAVTAYNYSAIGAVTMESPYLPFVRAHEGIWREAQRAAVLPYQPLLTSNWDARPWHGTKSAVRFGRTTAAMEDGLRRMKAHLDKTGGRIGILEAWNEWGEGSFIEPNLEFGFEDLEAIRRVFAKPGDWPANVGPEDVGLKGYGVR